MPAATLTEKGQVVIPAEIRARYDLTPGTQVEFVDDGGTIRLLVRRRVARSDPAAGYGGLVKVKPRPPGSRPRRLSEFDPASALKKPRSRA
jgi:AbrB family looped-hinge helix DNA binding protein